MRRRWWLPTPWALLGLLALLGYAAVVFHADHDAYQRANEHQDSPTSAPAANSNRPPRHDRPSPRPAAPPAGINPPNPTKNATFAPPTSQ
jgi:hypothetical protein